MLPLFHPSKLTRRVTLTCLALLLTVLPMSGLAQSTPTTQDGVTPPANLISLPQNLPPAPIIAPGKSGQYILEFNRSPVVGNRLRFEGIYDEQRLRFTRPRNWTAKSVKVLLRYRHSAALYATRSNLTVLVNGTSIGSVPLNQPQGEIGDAVFDLPPDLLQDYNELVLAALQNNSPTCTQDPFDPSLWTEVLPDSKLVFDFEPQPVTPDFSQFPYPLFDQLSLEANQVAYLQPATPDSAWLTAAAQLHSYLGRVAQYRPLDNRLVSTIDQVNPQERLVVLGTPTQQPMLADLTLPLDLQSGQFVDEAGEPLPPGVGLLMWTTQQQDQMPVLVVTANDEIGLGKAVQYLVQPQDSQIATGHALVVNQVDPIPSPNPRHWPGYLPEQDSFELKQLHPAGQPPLADLTVRGSHTPALEVDFKALPDDQFLTGSTFTLNYSYGPQINPLTSLVDVVMDGVSLEGARLTSVDGADRQSLTVTLPRDRITPTSKLQVNFRLDPRERRSCSRVTDQQLWGTIHSDSHFDLKREAVARLPDLHLLQTGFPFTAPQDLAATALVLPEKPDSAEIELLLETVERLGRLSQAESIQLTAYRQPDLTEAIRTSHHLIGIGPQAQFPLPELLSDGGFSLQKAWSRQWGASQVQTLPDDQGLVKAVMSPWNNQYVALALSSQTSAGLAQVNDLMRYDPLFYQLAGDTVLVKAQGPDPDPYDANAYSLEILHQTPQVELATTTSSPWLWRLTRAHWLFLVPAMLTLTLLIYGVAQAYIRRRPD